MLFVNSMKVTSSLRPNLQQKLPQMRENVRCYGIFKSWGFASRYQLARSKLTSSTVKVSTPKLTRNFADGLYRRLDTNVANNVILWKYENPKYFKKMNILSAVQFIILIPCSYVAWTSIPIRNRNTPWREYFKKAFLSSVLCFFALFAAFATSGLIWFFTRRSLKYIVLNKGGTRVTLVSYHPIKGTTTQTVSLNDIIVKRDRNDVGIFISLKVKGSRFFHIIDKEGSFVNPDLYDQTVGLDRNLEEKKKIDAVLNKE